MQKFHHEIKDYTVDSIEYFRRPQKDSRIDLIGRGVSKVVISIGVGDEKKFFVGMSRCSKKDVFTKARGRTIALGRALKTAFHEINNISKFVSDKASNVE